MAKQHYLSDLTHARQQGAAFERQYPNEWGGRICCDEAPPEPDKPFYYTAVEGDQMGVVVFDSPKCFDDDTEVAFWHTHPPRVVRNQLDPLEWSGAEPFSEKDWLMAVRGEDKDFWSGPMIPIYVTMEEREGQGGSLKTFHTTQSYTPPAQRPPHGSKPGMGYLKTGKVNTIVRRTPL